jgi:predicted nucleic-acid-binding protein
LIALDTNVVVRFLVDDDAAQALRARKLLERESVFIPVTVLLETEWVLRAAYEFETAAIAGFLRALLGLPQVSVDDPRLIAEALRCYQGGVDFADALHLALAGEASALASFDGKLAKRAQRLQARQVVAP